MPFVIVVVALVLIYYGYLTILQLISGPKRDSNSSLPVPPRALTGNGAWPVLGHTILFHKFGSDVAFLFPPEWREWRCFPSSWSRRLADVFCIFVWGQWNIVAKGHERVEKVILEGDVTEGWPYNTPPITLLGKTCLAILEEEEATCLRSMISEPLSHASVVKLAPQFAELAQKCIDEILAGNFNKGDRHSIRPGESKDSDGTAGNSGDEDLMNTSDSTLSDSEEKAHMIKLDALRSYTLDLTQGPVLNLDHDYRDTLSSASQLKEMSSRSLVEADNEKSVRFEEDTVSNEPPEKERPSKEMLLLWMDRLKDGLCDIKFTYGPQWMQLWRLNPYGRALNARKKLETLLSSHIEECEKNIPVHHEKGRATRDPFTSALPLWRLTENYFFPSEHPIMGFRRSLSADANRTRTQSENDIVPEMAVTDSGFTKVATRPRFRASSEPDVLDVQSSRLLVKNPARKTPQSVLDRILRSADYEGRGVTRVATTEITLLIWMMMDAGQAWTSMAMYLLSKHEDACNQVQAEIDRLEQKYKDRLFTSFVLGKMNKLDNLIYEAMRFCPPFMGGLKTVNQTIELDGVQVPKNSTVFLSNPHDEETFSINYDPPKRPEEMGIHYPSVDLYGTLPLQGLEIPIMVLQTKIFLIVLLQNHTPIIPGKRQTFMRRMTRKITKSIRHIRTPSSNEMSLESSFQRSRSADDLVEMERGNAISLSTPTTPTTRSLQQYSEVSSSPTAKMEKHAEIRHEERLFTRVPFPEPRRPIQIRPRADRILFATPNAKMLKPRVAERCETN